MLFSQVQLTNFAGSGFIRIEHVILPGEVGYYLTKDRSINVRENFHLFLGKSQLYKLYVSF